jgi:hypothetical protein
MISASADRRGELFSLYLDENRALKNARRNARQLYLPGRLIFKRRPRLRGCLF